MAGIPKDFINILEHMISWAIQKRPTAKGILDITDIDEMRRKYHNIRWQSPMRTLHFAKLFLEAANKRNLQQCQLGQPRRSALRRQLQHADHRVSKKQQLHQRQHRRLVNQLRSLQQKNSMQQRLVQPAPPPEPSTHPQTLAPPPPTSSSTYISNPIIHSAKVDENAVNAAKHP